MKSQIFDIGYFEFIFSFSARMISDIYITAFLSSGEDKSWPLYEKRMLWVAFIKHTLLWILNLIPEVDKREELKFLRAVGCPEKYFAKHIEAHTGEETDCEQVKWALATKDRIKRYRNILPEEEEPEGAEAKKKVRVKDYKNMNKAGAETFDEEDSTMKYDEELQQKVKRQGEMPSRMTDQENYDQFREKFEEYRSEDDEEE